MCRLYTLYLNWEPLDMIQSIHTHFIIQTYYVNRHKYRHKPSFAFALWNCTDGIVNYIRLSHLFKCNYVDNKTTKCRWNFIFANSSTQRACECDSYFRALFISPFSSWFDESLTSAFLITNGMIYIFRSRSKHIVRWWYSVLRIRFDAKSKWIRDCLIYWWWWRRRRWRRSWMKCGKGKVWVLGAGSSRFRLYYTCERCFIQFVRWWMENRIINGKKSWDL